MNQKYSSCLPFLRLSHLCIIFYKIYNQAFVFFIGEENNHPFSLDYVISIYVHASSPKIVGVVYVI